nr:zinc finger BED domain-containing protein RICESLEEPER 2-like [Tanacetum cinerariifolium]
MPPIITWEAASNPCFNVSGVELLSITTDLECFNDGFATMAKERFYSSLEGYDILGFWRAKESTFPILSQMDRDVLSVQATSVAFESSFSTSGGVLSIRRTKLTPTSLDTYFEAEILEEEVLEQEAIELSNEEIALDEAASEARSNESR